MNCSICNKPIVLVPSAAERARKFGGKPEDYTRLFKTHTECFKFKHKRFPFIGLPTTETARIPTARTA